MKSEITRLNNGLSELISVVDGLYKVIDRLNTELKTEREKRSDEDEELDNRLSRHIENCHGGY